MSERLLSAGSMDILSHYYDGFEAMPMPCLINGTYYDASAFIEQNATNTRQATGLLPHNQTAYLPKECLFEYEDTLGAKDYLLSTLTGFSAHAPEVDYSTSAWVGQLWNAGNITLSTVNNTWAAIAESMTIRIRQAGDITNSAPASGNVC